MEVKWELLCDILNTAASVFFKGGFIMRFDQFDDNELRTIERVMNDACKNLYANRIAYNEDEMKLINCLLNEAIQNVNQRYIERKRVMA